MTDVPQLFPQPQRVFYRGKKILFSKNGKSLFSIGLSPIHSSLEEEGAKLIQKKLYNMGVHINIIDTSKTLSTPAILMGVQQNLNKTSTFFSRLNEYPVNNFSQSYIIEFEENNVYLVGVKPEGVYYASQSFIQLLEQERDQIFLNQIAIYDWPDYPLRGIFEECYIGSGLKDLEDWKVIIDYLASLKMNILIVALYGCWRQQWPDPIEYLLVPIRNYPELQTPQKYEFYSVKEKKRKLLTYLPRMFEKDFFPSLIEYGKRRNILVAPMFNVLGHNTLIPRKFPEIAAKTAQGKPKIDGFCVSNPKTYDLIFRILGQIIKRYLVPNQIDLFHIGMDEVMDFCECPECRKISHAQQFTNHLIRICKYLKNKGIKRIVVNSDMLWRYGILKPNFINLLERERIKENLILLWWHYEDQSILHHHLHPALAYDIENIRPELKLKAWVAPTSNWRIWAPRGLENQAMRSLIYSFTKMGYQQGAEGVIAYSIFDSTFDQNYKAISDYSWNQRTTGTLDEFDKRYFQSISKEHWDLIFRAYRLYNKAIHILAPLASSIGSNKLKRFDQIIYEISNDLQIFDNSQKAIEKLLQAKNYLTRCLDLSPRFPQIIKYLILECDWISIIAQELEQVFIISKRYNDIVKTNTLKRKNELKKSLDCLKKLLLQHDQIMNNIESIKDHFNVPLCLVRMSILRDGLHNFFSKIKNMLTKIDNGEVEYPPVLEICPTEYELACNIKNTEYGLF